MDDIETLFEDGPDDLMTQRLSFSAASLATWRQRTRMQMRTRPRSSRAERIFRPVSPPLRPTTRLHLCLSEAMIPATAATNVLASQACYVYARHEMAMPVIGSWRDVYQCPGPATSVEAATRNELADISVLKEELLSQCRLT